MIGAILGDIIGSKYEFDAIKTKDFPLFSEGCHVTDDSIMTFAVAKSLLEAEGDREELARRVVVNMQLFGRKYPYAGYGARFASWIESDSPAPYHSYGNGSAMRVSPVAYVAESLDEVRELSYIVTAVTHDHPEGIKAAEAVAVAVYMAREGADKSEILRTIQRDYYDMDFMLDDIRGDYQFRVDAMASVPEALECFFESTSFEDAIRNAVSLGGDSDTQSAIAASIAEPFYGVPRSLRHEGIVYVDNYLLDILHRLEKRYGNFGIDG